MPRPRKCRRVGCRLQANTFKPAGVPMDDLQTVRMPLDELEALRLADLQGHYHAEAAELMGVSRPTFSRLLDSARRKVADALLNGKALVFQGGNVVHDATAHRRCESCDSEESSRDPADAPASTAAASSTASAAASSTSANPGNTADAATAPAAGASDASASDGTGEISEDEAWRCPRCRRRAQAAGDNPAPPAASA